MQAGRPPEDRHFHCYFILFCFRGILKAKGITGVFRGIPGGFIRDPRGSRAFQGVSGGILWSLRVFQRCFRSVLSETPCVPEVFKALQRRSMGLQRD